MADLTRRGVSSSALARAHSRRAAAAAIRRRAAGMAQARGATGCRPMKSSRGRARPRAGLHGEGAGQAVGRAARGPTGSRQAAAAERSALRRALWSTNAVGAAGRGEPDALRLRRADRCAECRQVDPDQPLVGAKITIVSPRCRPRGRASSASRMDGRARSSSSIRPASSARAAGSTGRWSLGLGRGGRRHRPADR